MSDTTTPGTLSVAPDPFEATDTWSVDDEVDLDLGLDVGTDDWDVDPFDDGGLDLGFDDLWDDGAGDYGVSYDSATMSFDTTANGSETATSYDSGFDF